MTVNWLPPGKDWVDLVAAFATPSIATLAAYFAYIAYRLERMRREDALFDRRFEWWRWFEQFWLQTGEGAPPGADPSADKADLLPWINEAELLFGPREAKVLEKLGDGHEGGGRVIEPHIGKPFLRE